VGGEELKTSFEGLESGGKKLKKKEHNRENWTSKKSVSREDHGQKDSNQNAGKRRQNSGPGRAPTGAAFEVKSDIQKRRQRGVRNSGRC